MASMKMDQEITTEAALEIRQNTLKALAEHDVTERKVALRLSESLDATEQKVFYDRDSGIVIYSKELINHTARLKAIEIASVLLDMKPSDKHDINLNGQITVEIIRFGKEDQTPE